ncbi:MAG: tRNA (adenosine(37)-N6)-threonylcarbamoyltransferase complex dimerization subunit type 1 TsaB [Gammaproteobacteria bacterium]|nr:tRNA (adenosine(37)-N6)-threonylcarbamoyltransferase complex dimerization subunit type 1 TsaB [Gammaproteobacteria bacterium]
MTKILSVETSTAACSVALAVGDEVVQRYALAAREHAQFVLPWVESLLAEAGLKLGQLDAIAVGRGPGGFTGVRIGVGVVQGLALGADLPVIPVSSLQVLAQTALVKLTRDNVLVGQDARMKEVYWAAYCADENGLMRAVIEDQLRLPEDVELPVENFGWCAVGDAWQQYEQALDRRLQGITFEKTEPVFPEAQYLGLLAAELFAGGYSVRPEEALPVYLRGKEAWALK